MFARLLLIAVISTLTAFAPAPFPKRGKKDDTRLSLERLQGTWVVQKVERSSTTGYQVTSDSLAEVRIEGSRWTFVNGQNGQLQPSRSLELKIDATKTPAWFDLGQPNSETSGILRLKGIELQVLYQWGRPRPGSFETPPEGYWFITFRRK